MRREQDNAAANLLMLQAQFDASNAKKELLYIELQENHSNALAELKEAQDGRESMSAEVTKFRTQCEELHASISELEEAQKQTSVQIKAMELGQQQVQDQHSNAMNEAEQAQRFRIFTDSQSGDQHTGPVSADDPTEEQPKHTPPSAVVAAFWEGFRLLQDQVDAFEQLDERGKRGKLSFNGHITRSSPIVRA